MPSRMLNGTTGSLSPGRVGTSLGFVLRIWHGSPSAPVCHSSVQCTASGTAAILPEGAREVRPVGSPSRWRDRVIAMLGTRADLSAPAYRLAKSTSSA